MRPPPPDRPNPGVEWNKPCNWQKDNAYWRDRPKPPGQSDDEITWCEEMAQYYMTLAAYLRDREGEHQPSPLSRTDA